MEREKRIRRKDNGEIPMKLQKIHLIGKKEAGKDPLGNSIYTNDILGESLGRVTEWTVTDVEMYGREVTRSNQKIQTIAPSELVRSAAKVSIDSGLPQEITQMIDGVRWRILHVKRYRS